MPKAKLSKSEDKRLLEETKQRLQRYAPIKIIGIKIIRSIKSEKSAVTGLGPYKLQVKIS